MSNEPRSVQVASAMTANDRLLRQQEGHKQYAVHTNWMSFVGHPCTRYIFYKRTRWQEAQVSGSASLFWLGRELEPVIVERARLIARQAGWELLRLPDRANYFTFDPMCAGKLDTVLDLKDGYLPIVVEIKTMADHVFKSVNSAEDMLARNEPWWRAAPYQLWSYEYGGNLPGWTDKDGMWLLMSKASGDFKFVPCPFNEELFAAMREKLEENERRIGLWKNSKWDECPDKDGVFEGFAPARIDYDHAVCGRCEFRGLCMPAETGGQGGAIFTETEVIGKFKRMMELEDAAQEYEELSKTLREMAIAATGDTQRGCIIVPDAGQILVSRYKATEYRMPEDAKTKFDEFRAQFAVKVDRARVKFEGID